MRVLYFHQHFSTPRGSSGTRSYEFAKTLAQRGHSVTVVCGCYEHGDAGLGGPSKYGVRRGKVENFEVVQLVLPYSNYQSLFKRTLVFLRFALFSSRVALTWPADLLFATSTPLTIAIPGIIARWLRGLPFVLEIRDLWPELPKAMGVVSNRFVLAAMLILEWLAYRSAHFVIGLSPGMVRGVALKGVPADRLAMIPNGCDTELFGPLDEKHRPAIPGVATTDFVALFCGAHGVANGLFAVLDAAAVLKRNGRSDIRLVFVGDGKLKPQLIERAADDGLTNCVFLPPMPKTELARFMASSDAGLMILDDVPAFYYGTSPNKFFDYISAGLPVLVNYPGWVADMVIEHCCGSAVRPRDPEAFADALVRLADDSAALRSMGYQSRRLAETQFQRSALASRFADVLENVLRENQNGRLGLLAKRAFDVVVALLILLLFSPLLLLISVLVGVFLGRPVLFKQDRPGFRGRPFKMYKFRTMKELRDSEGMLLPDGQRLTRFGRLLRKTSCDELPELWNVLLGDMSFVGPRPLLMQYLDRYSPEQARRQLVKPGITGWAQINGRNAISWEQKFGFDVWYVDHWSFWLDLKILMMTIGVVLTGKGIASAKDATMPEFNPEP